MTEIKFQNKFMRIILTLVFIGQAILSWAQPDVELANYQKKYPGTQMVVLNEVEELHLELVNNEVLVYETSYSKKMYLSKDAGMFRERELGFSSFSSISDVEAITLVPNGNKYKKIKTKEFKESDDMSSSVFHDDSKIISFSFQGMQIGAISELSYKTTIKDPHFLGRSLLQDRFPIENKTYKVVVDEGIEMAFTEYLIDKDFIEYSKTEEKGKTIYTWTVKNSPVIISEKWAPNITYYTPQVFPRVATFLKDGEKEPVLRDVSDLFAWYETFVDTVNMDTDNKMIQSTVDSITAGATSDLEKVKRVFEWTQENIKYVAYEAGLGGFVPRSAISVCTNRYGDCKDMSSTITHLLKYAGIESHLTWIGTNAIPFTYEQLPTPSVDNHMIATYIDKDGSHYFMDATGRYMNFGMPSSFIQNQEALIRIGSKKYEIFKVPMVAPKQNGITDVITATVTNGIFTGKATSSFNGYYKQNLEYKIEDLNETDKAKFYKDYLRKGSNKFLPTNFVETNPYPSPKPYAIEYDFTIEDYLLTNENELYINFHLSDFFSGDKIKDDRSTPFLFKFVSQHTEKTEFTIPDGYVLDYLPESISIDNELIFYKSEYKSEGNKIFVETQSYKKKLLYAHTDVTLWNKNINTIIKSQKNVVILKKAN